MSFISFLLFLAIFLAVLYAVAQAFPRQAAADRVPPALRIFAALMRSRGYAPAVMDGQLVFPFPVRGAGLVCNVTMNVDDYGAISAKVWLPTPVPKANRIRVILVANEINALSMLGSWNLNDANGDCWFAMWTYAVEEAVPAFVPDAMFGQIETSIDADLICRAAYE